MSNDAGSIRPFRTEDEGATLVEIALASSILFAAVFGVIIMSFALYTYDFLADAAREGARYAIVRGLYCTGFSDCNADESQISSYVKSIAYPGINPNNMTVTASWYTVKQFTSSPTTVTLCANTNPAGCNIPGNAVAVTVTYAFPLNIPFWTSTTLNMSSMSQLVISQ
ncbi:MAG TPA: TadE/TadG family type IV pilus assembly protein [Terracidiphilus sp.]|nr:TadE/TadG family type IV pilus assembly protein [Terracidiphilus sp.]